MTSVKKGNIPESSRYKRVNLREQRMMLLFTAFIIYVTSHEYDVTRKGREAFIHSTFSHPFSPRRRTMERKPDDCIPTTFQALPYLLFPILILSGDRVYSWCERKCASIEAQKLPKTVLYFIIVKPRSAPKIFRRWIRSELMRILDREICRNAFVKTWGYRYLINVIRTGFNLDVCTAKVDSWSLQSCTSGMNCCYILRIQTSMRLIIYWNSSTLEDKCVAYYVIMI